MTVPPPPDQAFPTSAPARLEVPRAPRRPGQDPAVCRAIEEFVYTKGGALRPHYALLCVVYWLQREFGEDAASAADVKAILPRLGGVSGRLRSPADTLRHARDADLVEALGGGWYRLTALGIAVVDALPDAEQVGEIRGARRAHTQRRLAGGPVHR